MDKLPKNQKMHASQSLCSISKLCHFSNALQWLEIGGYASKPSVSDQAGLLKIRNDFFNEILLQDFHLSHRWVDCGLFLHVGELNGRFHKKPFMWKYKCMYYIASSVSGQDKPNRSLRLATRAGKMELSCPLGTTRRVPQEKFPRKPNNKSLLEYMDHNSVSVSVSSHLDLTLGQ